MLSSISSKPNLFFSFTKNTNRLPIQCISYTHLYNFIPTNNFHQNYSKENQIIKSRSLNNLSFNPFFPHQQSKYQHQNILINFQQLQYYSNTPLDDEKKIEKTLWQRSVAFVKHEAHHYWTGTKLFVVEIRTSFRLVNKSRKKELTRREKKLLRTTLSDLFKMVPFLLMVIIPLADFLIPVAIKLFPNFLPSTFETKFQKEEKMKKKLKVKIQMTSFLQDVAEDMAKKKYQLQGDKFNFDFKDFMMRIKGGEFVSNKEILQFVKIFEDSWTLDNLPREQLVALSRYVGLPPYGTMNYLRGQLERKFDKLKKDDMLIRKEGLARLNYSELQKACQDRGIKALDVPEAQLYKRLNHWLSLSLDEKLPPVLLLLSRALAFTSTINTEQYQSWESHRQPQIQDIDPKLDTKKEVSSAIKSLPEQLIDLGEKKESQEETNDSKLESIQKQNELIQEEETEKQESSKETKPPKAEKVKPKDIGEALDSMSSPSAVHLEESIVGELKSKQLEHEIEEEKEDVATTALNSKIQHLLSDLEEELKSVSETVGEKMYVIDKDKDGKISTEEFKYALGLLNIPDELTEEEIQKLMSKMQIDRQGKLDLRQFAKLLRDEDINAEE